METKQKKRTTIYSTIALLAVAAVPVTALALQTSGMQTAAAPIEVSVAANLSGEPDSPAAIYDPRDFDAAIRASVEDRLQPQRTILDRSLPDQAPASTEPAILATDPSVPLPGDPIWAVIDAGSLDGRTSSATEVTPSDYSNMWRFLNSNFAVEHQPADYSYMWAYLHSDYLGPAIDAKESASAADVGSLTTIDRANLVEDEVVGITDGEPLLGMVDSSVHPHKRWPG